MQRFILVSLALLVATPALALNSWGQCGGSASLFGAPTSPNVGSSSCHEFRFDSSVGSATTFTVSTESAVLLFDPDITASGTASATVMIQMCLQGDAAAEGTCVDMLSANLDGTPGSPSLQRSAIRLKRGFYRISFEALPVSETAVIQVRGED